MSVHVGMSACRQNPTRHVGTSARVARKNQPACRRADVPTCILLALGLALNCATSRVPAFLRRYDILVTAKDRQSIALAKAMRSSGYHVRERVRGGSRPTAVLVHFTSSDPGSQGPTWLYVRLADTRTGVIVAAAAIEVDSTTRTPDARAAAAVRALAAP
jgi:hypothetical protein